VIGAHVEAVMQQPTDVALITADLIVKYGFLGVGLALTIIIAPLIFAIWKSRMLTTVTVTFGLAFIVTWGVLNVVQQYFPYLIASKRVLLNGAVYKVPNGYQVQISSDVRMAGAAYLKRENDTDDRELNSFLFLLLSSQQPSCLALAINSNDPTAEAGSSAFKITPISDVDLKNESFIVAEAHRLNKKFQLTLWREVSGKQMGDTLVLNPLDDSTPGCAAGHSARLYEWLIPSAFGQSRLEARELSARLRSDDLFTRRDARIDLSKEVPDNLQMTEEFLNSSDYRLQLGALVALSILPPADRKNLPPDVLAKVKTLMGDSDSTIRETASSIEADLQ
jgi:hypothetical protein